MMNPIKPTLLSTSFDVNRIRQDFPVLNTRSGPQSLCYLDNAATTQKPQVVIDRIRQFYETEYATIGRGIYELSQNATRFYEETRQAVQQYLHASRPEEIVFTKGTTEAINLVAVSYASHLLKPGDQIMVSEVEHHANFVPWQQLCLEKGLELVIIPVNDAGEIDLAAYQARLTDRTQLVAIAHISNVLGSIHPIEKMIELAHQKGAVVLIDGAQSAAHLPVDVQKLDCDFYCFSGHKAFGPTGVGVLYSKYHLLNQMKPYQYGGDMIETVSLSKTTFADPPKRFEAGTPPFIEVIALKFALEYIQTIGIDAIRDYEHQLLTYATKRLTEINGIRIIGTAAQKASVVSFVWDPIHPHDIGTILSDQGVAVRVGHHCSQITMQRFGIPATVRASFCFYNTFDEIDRLINALRKVKDIMG